MYLNSIINLNYMKSPIFDLVNPSRVIIHDMSSPLAYGELDNLDKCRPDCKALCSHAGPNVGTSAEASWVSRSSCTGRVKSFQLSCLPAHAVLLLAKPGGQPGTSETLPATLPLSLGHTVLLFISPQVQ